jgi:hypothetical protein
VRTFLQPPVQGVVLQTYGAGNGPDARKDLLAVCREATDRGVIVINCTQCARGVVTAAYATGKVMYHVILHAPLGQGFRVFLFSNSTQFLFTPSTLILGKSIYKSL